MAYTIDGKLKVAVSSRALFQLEKEDDIFTTKGKEAYEKYQIKHEKDILQPGAAFPVVKALLELGEDDVEVIVVSRNTADMSLRVFNSIQAHNLNICRGFFTGGESIINYLKSLDIDLFLTANDDSAKAAIDNGIPAATMITSAAKYMTESTELRVAFDGDAVLFGDESEAIFKAEGLEAFGKNESEKANIPMKEGPMAKFLRALAKIQTKQEKEGKNNETKIVTALVTARSAPAHARTIKTLRAWGIKVNQAFFLGGLDKTYVLKEFKPQIFFDDQHVHTDRASVFMSLSTPRIVRRKIMLTKWIIAIGNTEADGVRMLYAIGSVDQIKRALVELALEDKSNDEESFNYGTEDISDVEETADSKTNEVTVLNAYNVFSDYHIDYTAQRLDSMQMREV